MEYINDKFSGNLSASVDIMTRQNHELPRSEHFKYLGSSDWRDYKGCDA